MSEESKLIFKDVEDITLPVWILESNLTLAEIGAVFCLSCIKENPVADGMKERMASKAMAQALVSMQKKGVLTANVTGTTVSCRLDLHRARVSKGGAA